ncbi:hypothetical protein KSD_07650 [Ktedonobacter sp. SOSP1-85]|uniref:hypothetical protein n=1 Tax=Ktedonobacter sp. SOSP1-85 TaxID=2778367 RepID=UPI00191680F1|nr:hypothetical protein [Ktedonobacter sp. SOSP1-85]GHO72994.1 hypothetical protein KSD_07650 [Ktedonobacter sp. SOSP1-85]
MTKKREAVERYWTYSGGLAYSHDNACSDVIARATEQYVQNGITTYVAQKPSYSTADGNDYVVLFESGQGTKHYVRIDSLESYISFMRSYANLTHIFDAIVKPLIDEWEKLQSRRNATVGGGYGRGPSDMY